MANTFLNSDIINRTVKTILDMRQGVLSRVNRTIEGDFKPDQGDEVKVQILSPGADAEDYSGSLTAADRTESYKTVKLTGHPHKVAEITSKEKRLDIYDFTGQVVMPLVRDVVRTIEKRHVLKMAAGFARNLVGTAGNDPSTLAHLIAGVKQLKDNKVPYGLGYNGIITTGAWANLAGLTQMTSGDYGANRPASLQNGSLPPVVGIRELFDTQLVGDFDQGDVAGTVLVNGASESGTSLAVDGFTAETGTVKAGTRFTIDGIAGTTFTVTADATLESNATTLSIYPALPSSPSDDAAITFETAFKENIVYYPGAVASAVIAPEPLGSVKESTVISYGNARLRVSILQSNLEELIVVDSFEGCKVLMEDAGVIVNG